MGVEERSKSNTGYPSLYVTKIFELQEKSKWIWRGGQEKYEERN